MQLADLPPWAGPKEGSLAGLSLEPCCCRDDGGDTLARNAGHDSVLRAVDYLSEVLAQGANIARAAQAAGLDYAEFVGPQIRHVLEHVEEFIRGLDAGVIDYDRRLRDRAVENDAALACRRLAGAAIALRERLSRSWPDAITLLADGGLDGSQRFSSSSTPVRELLFLASHSIHHYAIVRAALLQRGLTLPEHVGVAPATVRYQRERAA